jgi:hypothetical protein
VQVTISIVLLVPTGLLLKSRVNLLHLDPGIRTANVIGFRITPQWNVYALVQCKAIFERAETELAAIPEVRTQSARRCRRFGNSTWVRVSAWKARHQTRDGPLQKCDEVGPRFFGQTGSPTHRRARHSRHGDCRGA